MSRSIDAEWVIKRLQAKKPSNDYMRVMLDECIAEIKSAPTIEPERKTGKWIGYAGTIGNECSVCHKWLDVLQGTAAMNYCPNCGASMVNED